MSEKVSEEVGNQQHSEQTRVKSKGKRLRNTLNSTILEAIKSWKLEVEKAAAIEVGSMDHDLHDLLNPENGFLPSHHWEEGDFSNFCNYFRQ